MKIVTRDGICFVIDLVWQKDNPDNKINILKIKKVFDFSLYTRTDAIEPSLCFAPASHELQKLISNKTQLNSLTVFVLESLKEVFSGMIEDSFICFKIDNDNYGVIFIYKGGVIANDGELIGNAEAIKEFIIKNAYRYNVLVAHVLTDVTFLIENDFLSKNGLELIRHESQNEELSASDYYLWQQDERFKKSLKKSTLKTLDLIQEEHKAIAKKILIIAGAVFLLLALILGLKSCFFKPEVHQVIKEPIKARPKFVVPVNNQRGIEVKTLMKECFSSLKDLPKFLEIQEINCNLKVLQVNFQVNNYDHAKAIQFVNDLFSKDASINMVESAGISMISLVKPLPLSKIPPPQLHGNSLMERIRLEKLGLVHNMKVSFDKTEIDESIAVATTPQLDSAGKPIESPSDSGFKLVPHKVMINTVKIVSPYSPFYLNKNHVLDRINVYNIYMKINQDETATWIIKGEFSGD